ncbi:MAG: CHAT domain-containing protein, partial [Pseudomonadota bacterium]
SKLFRVPGHRELSTVADAVEGLSDLDQQSSQALLDSLYQRLLAQAIDSLTADVRHLIMIPDSGIDGFPLELMSGVDGIRLGERFSIDIAPSASIWLQARMARAKPGEVLVLADPEVSERRFRMLSDAFPGFLPDELPAAAHEASAIRSMLGRRSVQVWQGPQAREEILLDRATRPALGMIHFATHTLVNARQPEASAVVLSEGQHTDGLLQAREVERLTLAGTAVVLASCASATGEMLDNEGVISLARSFLVAGSPSVIASRWPVSDQHAQTFFVRMYWHLSRGHSLSESMRMARVELREQGLPKRIWSAFVLYGDGRRYPVRTYPDWPAWLMIALAGFVLLLVLAKLRKA